MASYVALLRAVNAGGSGKLPMSDLKRLCHEAGFESIRTYIASGNVVFSSSDSPDKARSVLEKRLEDWAGARMEVLVRTAREMADLVAANPYPDQPGNQVAVLFLERQPPGDLAARISGVGNERFSPAAKEVFVHYPDGLGQSKLKFDLGMGTTRNMNTVSKLAAMAAAT